MAVDALGTARSQDIGNHDIDHVNLNISISAPE